jgi:hypothetical protein
LKPALTIGLAITAVAAMLSSLVKAGPTGHEQPAATETLPAYEILSNVRSLGLDPTSAPALRGPYYVLHALDAHGVEMQVVADAQLGDIVSVVPMRLPASAYGPDYERGPRIIHVPQPAAADDDKKDADVAPLPQRRGIPHRRHRSETPAPEQKRTLLSAPPLPEEGPTPIRPIPDAGAKTEINIETKPDTKTDAETGTTSDTKADAGDKFAPPPSVDQPPPPPPGNTPPAASPPPPAASPPGN